MPVPWMISIVVLWILVICETFLLLLLLRALGAMKIQSTVPQVASQVDIGGLSIGTVAPSFLSKDTQGTPLQLTDSDGQSRIIVFVKPGCSACLDALSILNNYALQEDHPIIHIFSLADQKANLAYASNYSPQLSILTPEDNVTCERMYDIRAVPFAFAIDSKRVIQAKSIVSTTKQFEQLLIHTPERISSSL